MWFDDFYFPCQTPPPGYPIDVWDRGGVEFSARFSDRQLEILARFNEIFAAELDSLPESADWQGDPGWKRVSKAARSALEGIRLIRQD